MQGQQAGGGSSMVLSAGSATTLEPLRRECIEAIEARELLLRRLYGISLSPDQAPGMVRLLRAAALRVVECIATWHRGVRAAMDDPDDPAVGARFDASSMPAACCLLSTVCCLLFNACCLLFIHGSVISPPLIHPSTHTPHTPRVAVSLTLHRGLCLPSTSLTSPTSL